MKDYGVFDIIGPQMIGPSSSHTAGAVRIGEVACRLAQGKVKKAVVTLYGSFATTGRGHGTDKAVTAGLLGFMPDDLRIRNAPEIARETGKDITVVFSDEPADHPNTAVIDVTGENGERTVMRGVSVGGGNIEIRELNGMEVSFSCDYPTLLIFHQDKPGMISLVTGILAEYEINVAYMRAFRQSKRNDAYMVIETDEQVPGPVVKMIRAADRTIERVIQI